jgi:hypothetical protein
MYASGNNRPMIRINGLSMLGRTCAALGLLGAMATPAGALTFEYSFTAGTPTLAQDAFVAAGNLWSSVLFDPVTIKLTVGTAVLGNGTLAQAVSSQVAYNYTSVVAAMTADATSANDVLAVSNLPVGSVAMLINRTQENGNSATPYFDNTGSNSATIQMSTANAAALGLPFGRGTLGGLCLVACDGFIQFNSNFNFDYDRSNGLTSNQFDFIGIAAHEIGHSLGFISGWTSWTARPVCPTTSTPWCRHWTCSATPASARRRARSISRRLPPQVFLDQWRHGQHGDLLDRRHVRRRPPGQPLEGRPRPGHHGPDLGAG